MKKITILALNLFFFITYNSFAQPVNDVPCGATLLDVNLDDNCLDVTYNFDDTETDTSGFGDPSCLFSRTSIDDRWYTFVMPADGSPVRIKTSYQDTSPTFNPFDDPAIEVFKVTNELDACNNLVSIDCNDDGNPDTLSSKFFPQIDIIEPANTIIYFRVWHNNGDNIGDFNICLFTIDPPLVASNDECSSAENLALTSDCSTPVLSTNFQASPSTDADPSCASNDGDDVWYIIDVLNDKFYDISIETSEDSGSAVFDTGIAVYSGACGALVEVGCDDDSGTDFFSRIDLTGRKGELLYIRVFPVQIGQTGTFNICATATETLAIPEREENVFAMYPNPAIDIVNLEFNQISSRNITVDIYNIQGKLALKTSESIQNNRAQLDVSTLKTGLYFLKVNDGNNSFTQKLIIR